MRSTAWIRDVGMYARFAAGLPRFFRERITLDQAQATVRRRLATRDARFLELMERAVYGHPGSPYLPLLREARCELGDLRSMVADRGLEASLLELRSSGVWVGFEEFKGRAPMRTGRDGSHAGRHTFDNPFLVRRIEGSSGGSTGPATRVPYDLDATLSRIPSYVLGCDAHGVLDAPIGLWRFGLPSMTGITNALRSVVIGNPVRRWFTPDGSGDLRPALRFRAATAFVVRTSRLLGQPIPLPEPVPLERADVVARWAAGRAKEEGKCLVRASVSMALRIALAAEAEGIDLRGVALMGGSEPITATKFRAITRSGARQIPTYTCSEAGPVGMGCANPVEENDLHFLEDLLALVQHPRRIPGTEIDVEAFCLTTLNPSAPMILLNVEIDDFGIVERRSCGCPLEEAGYGLHLRGVRSYRKLTGEGVTLVGSDMVRILEEVLPATFGGAAHHYQLHQREDADGFSRMILVVDPEIRLPSEDAARKVVLDTLAGRSGMEDFARSLWQMAGTLSVERRPTEWTARGKYPSLVVRRG
jgi:hypothetical protein